MLWWGGLRGSVSIAVALSVPVVLGDRQEIINIIFGVVLFTLLVQGLTTQWVLEKLDLIGDQPIRQKYSEYLARRVALKRVLNYLDQLNLAADVDEEFYRYERDLVEGELETIEEKIEKLKSSHPQLQELDMKQLRDTLLDIEADTYAEFIRVGRLNKDLSPLLQETLIKATEKNNSELTSFAKQIITINDRAKPGLRRVARVKSSSPDIKIPSIHEIPFHVKGFFG